MKNKNILILGSNENFSLEKMYLRAFKKLNYKVSIFHTYDIRKNLINRILWKYFRLIIFALIRKHIINYLKNDKKKKDIIIIFKGLYINKIFLSKIRKISNGTKIVNIFPDNPFDVDYFKDISLSLIHI